MNHKIYDDLIVQDELEISVLAYGSLYVIDLMLLIFDASYATFL
jgi:hypothetical protein